MSSLAPTPDFPLIMGPGPTNLHLDVKQAYNPEVLHTNPAFQGRLASSCTDIKDILDVREDGVRGYLHDESATHILEARIRSLVHSDTGRVLVLETGYFARRLLDQVQRAFGHQSTDSRDRRIDVHSCPPGQTIPKERIEEKIKKGRLDLLIGVWGNTDSGVWQPLDGLKELVNDQGGLMLVDGVTPAFGMKTECGRTIPQSDIFVTGGQKCAGGVYKTSFELVSNQARMRSTRHPDWYSFGYRDLDQYYAQHKFHHTLAGGPIDATGKALEIAHEEGMKNRVARHEKCGNALDAALATLECTFAAGEDYRMPMLRTVVPPEDVGGVDAVDEVRTRLGKVGILTAPSLLPDEIKGHRIGCMAFNARKDAILCLAERYGDVLKTMGYTGDPMGGFKAAEAILGEKE